MELEEVIVQGLPGARELARASFAPALTLLPAGPRERLYLPLLLDLLYPKSDALALAERGEPAEQGRVAVVVIARDGQRYRLLLDVHTGRRVLQRYVDGRPEMVCDTVREIALAVTAVLGFPHEEVLRELLCAVREDLPSRRAKLALSSSPRKEVSSAAARRPLPPGFSACGTLDRSAEQARQRLTEIEGLLRADADFKALEFAIDGLQQQLFALEERMRPLTALQRAVQQAKDQVERLVLRPSAPVDLIDSAARLVTLRAASDRECARLDDNKRELLARAQGMATPLQLAHSDPFVKYGVLFGVAALVLGLVGALAGSSLRWLALLDIPTLGLAVVGGMRVLSVLEEGERIRRSVQQINVDKQRIQERLGIDQEHVHGLLNKHGIKLEQLAELAGELRARAAALTSLATAESALAAANGDDLSLLESEQATITARMRALEEQLSASGAGMFTAPFMSVERSARCEAPKQDTAAPFCHSPRINSLDRRCNSADIRAEKVEIERRLTSPTAALLMEPGSIEPERTVAEDLTKRLLELAAEVTLSSVPEVGAQVQERAAHILHALSDGRLHALRFGGRGETSALDAAGDAIPFGDMPPLDRDIAWLSLKIALIEMVVARARLPVIFDRSLDFLLDSKGPMLQRMLQFLAAATQVISISDEPALGRPPL